MSKDKTNNDESQNKGGRNPKYNAEFFTLKGHRSDELEILKMQFGADGIDFYVSVFETLCVSDYFIYPFKKEHMLQLLAKKKDIEVARFLEILKYCVEELELFDKKLYEKGYIFCDAFVRAFDGAGLFYGRKMTIEDIMERVNEIRNPKPLNEISPPLTQVNQILTELNPTPASVEPPKVNNSITDNSREKEEESIKKQKNSKEEINLNKTRESLKYKSESEKKDDSREYDNDCIF